MLSLVLASSSKYRQAILVKLHHPFEISSPNIDESLKQGETAEQLVVRLSEEKAQAVAVQHPNALIIGSDQVAVFNNTILTKPGNHENAVQQLSQVSGHCVTFYTGLCVYNSSTCHSQVQCVPFKVHFRKLDSDQIERYLRKEKPYDCAGSFKSESFGISLFNRLEGDDPNTLIGLPLINLIAMLANEGLHIP